MNLRRPVSIPRRKVVAAGLGALALAVPGAKEASARVMLVRGMAGGGLAQLEGSDEPSLANFALFASAMQFPEGTTLVLGRVQWIAAGTDLRLDSTSVVQCVPTADRPDGAEIRGRMTYNGQGDYPFVLRAIDAGRPGSGLDRVELAVNTPEARQGAEDPSDEEFTYEAKANLVAGDCQWLIVDVDQGD